MRILVTGAQGYVGGVLTSFLRAFGMDVITAGRRGTTDLHMDFADVRSVASCKFPRNIDACVHAAGAHDLQCRNDPVSAYMINVAGSRALVQACQKAGVRHLIYISTFHVFGRPRGDLTEAVPATPLTDYGLTHRQAEQVFELAERNNGMAVDVLRPANIYGVPADWETFNRWSLAPFDFCHQAVTHGRIGLHGHGRAVRNYHSAAYLAEIVLNLLHDGGKGLTHIAGAGWSIRDLARMAATTAEMQMGISVPVTYGAEEAPSPDFTYASNRIPSEPGDVYSSMQAFFNATISHLLEQGR